MPPRKKGVGIIKSGNAGNSSKANKSSGTGSSAPLADAEKPLFPVGYKYPTSLLNERCQKNGWGKANIDVRKHADGFSFAVSLTRPDPKTSQVQTVRLEPHPPYILPTAPEARQWGATYALYRFCNGFHVNRVLPPGPREYWGELAAEHKNAPEHMKWMYHADPFVARKEVEERQAKKKNEGSSTEKQVSNQYDHFPEVKMASDLRIVVEDAIKKAISLYPESTDVGPIFEPETNSSDLAQQLCLLGFTPVQARNAVGFLSNSSPLASNLLGTLSPLEGAIEYLVLHVPECDLPQRFLPATTSSDPFITSVHAGDGDLKKRWIENKAIVEAGWPARVVKEFTSDARLLKSWELLVAALDYKLIGEDWNTLFEANDNLPERSGVYTIIPDEVEALGAHYVDSSEVVMPLFTAPVQLHILVTSKDVHPPMYITSNKVPPYVRLHLLSQLLRESKKDDFVGPEEGICLAVMRFLEEEWASIEDKGPPDMSEVLQHLVPRPTPRGTQEAVTQEPIITNERHQKRRGARQRRDSRSDGQIRAEFEAICRSDEYGKMLLARKRLPAFTVRDEFLELLDRNRVVIVVGETGSGKTTQMPQFILDSLILGNNGSKASLVVTQPRRISAISVASRVSTERLDDASVGYAIRGESKQGNKTKLLFCTTGVVLRRLGSGDSLEGVTHVIVDEVHERSLDGDFLLLELKQLLQKHRTIKIILMSATINHETFVKYFDGAPLLTIPGRTFPVTDMYLEDVVSSIKYQPPSAKSTKKESEEDKRVFREKLEDMGLSDQSIQAVRNISRSGRIDYQLIAALVNHVISTSAKQGGVLIFLPGVQEIRQCIDTLRDISTGKQVDIFPLHANLTSEEQCRVFISRSRWKIIVATNVAETSITIDDVIYVIDSGRVKETQYDPETNLSRLVETSVTRAAARQRRGRAGRTQAGVCYKLYTRQQEENMVKFPVPEILRVPLESISLSVKAAREEEDVKHFLSRAIDPPNMVAMENAWSTLEELGAVDEDGRLTALGRHMAMLPVDLRIGKLLVLGAIFRCLTPILTIAACLSSKPLFLSPMDKREEATKARARFATGGSDLLTDLHAYDECARLRSEGKPQHAIKAFCEENFISPSTLREITSLRHDFLSSLSELGLVPLSSTPASPSLNTNRGNTNLLKAIVVGGLWPRIARVHLPKSAVKFDKVQAGTVQRENTAREFKMYDMKENTRVFLHPSSVLFDAASWNSPFLVYFHKQLTSKVFLRDATQVPLYALLLFGGQVSVNHVAGGVDVGGQEGRVKLKAWPRIGILVNQLRRLLDVQLTRCIEEGTALNSAHENPILGAILELLSGDGLTGQDIY